ncbi:hypothetical protein Ancab_038075, partial [Ancistrocladus abbreviatus]
RKSDSFIWKAMVKGKKIIQLRACYGVATGGKINIWEDPWLAPFHLLSRVDSPLEVYLVKDLLLENYSWNVLIGELFDDEPAEKILLTPNPL